MILRGLRPAALCQETRFCYAKTLFKTDSHLQTRKKIRQKKIRKKSIPPKHHTHRKRFSFLQNFLANTDNFLFVIWIKRNLAWFSINRIFSERSYAIQYEKKDFVLNQQEISQEHVNAVVSKISRSQGAIYLSSESLCHCRCLEKKN